MEAEVKTISINGTEYVPSGTINKDKDKDLSSDVRIVILQRGWIYVGRYSKTSSDEHRLDQAKCIRSWGTNKGLGELISGPTSSTKLDESGTVRFHPMTIVATLDCEADKWTKHL